MLRKPLNQHWLRRRKRRKPFLTLTRGPF
jgi:hypothetical protein